MPPTPTSTSLCRISEPAPPTTERTTESSSSHQPRHHRTRRPFLVCPIPPPAHRRLHRARLGGSPTVLRIERRSVAVADAEQSHHEHGYQNGPQSTQGPAPQVRLRRR